MLRLPQPKLHVSRARNEHGELCVRFEFDSPVNLFHMPIEQAEQLAAVMLAMVRQPHIFPVQKVIRPAGVPVAPEKSKSE